VARLHQLLRMDLLVLKFVFADPYSALLHNLPLFLSQLAWAINTWALVRDAYIQPELGLGSTQRGYVLSWPDRTSCKPVAHNHSSTLDIALSPIAHFGTASPFALIIPVQDESVRLRSRQPSIT